MATFVAKNNDKPINFGWVVRPTAATAYEPSELTIRESINPAKATKNDSIIAGQAMDAAVLKLFLSNFDLNNI